MSVIEHELTELGVATGIYGQCSCGWESDVFNTAGEVYDAWQDHCDVAFMEATGG